MVQSSEKYRKMCWTDLKIYKYCKGVNNGGWMLHNDTRN